MSELGLPLNSSFLLSTSLQFAWDSTSLGALKKCPRLYQYSIVLGYRSKRDNVHLTFGLIFHGATERYDHAKAKGLDHEEALRRAVRFAFEESWDKELNRPWASDDPNKNRLTLIRTIVWYLDFWNLDREDPLQTIILDSGKPAVELSFRFPLEFGPQRDPSHSYWYAGHFDRLAKFNDQTVIADKKTTKSTLGTDASDFFAGFTPDNQFSGYCLAGQVVYQLPISGIIVDAAQVAVTFSRFRRGLVQRPKPMLEEWHRDLQFWIKQAEAFAEAEYWPMNDKSCFMCDFRRVCSESPRNRERWLKSDFTRRVWDPLQVRGDI